MVSPPYYISALHWKDVLLGHNGSFCSIVNSKSMCKCVGTILFETMEGPKGQVTYFCIMIPIQQGIAGQTEGQIS